MSATKMLELGPDVFVNPAHVVAVRAGQRRGQFGSERGYVYDEIEVVTTARSFWVKYPSGTNCIEKRREAVAAFADTIDAFLNPPPAPSLEHTQEREEK